MAKKKDKALEALKETSSDVILEEPIVATVLEEPATDIVMEETAPGIFLGAWPTERQAGKHAASYREAHPGETAELKPEADTFAVYVSSYQKG